MANKVDNGQLPINTHKVTNETHSPKHKKTKVTAGKVMLTILKVIFFPITFFCWLFTKNNPLKLSEREVKLIDSIRDDQQKKKIEGPAIDPLKARDIKEITSGKTDSKKTDPKSLEVKEFQDSSIRNLRSFARDFVRMMVDEVYEEKVEKMGSQLKKGLEKAPEHFEYFTKLLIQLGEKASKSLLTKFKNQKSKLDPTLIRAIKWLRDDKVMKSPPLQLKLGNELVERLGQNLKPYVGATVNWFFNTDHTAPLKDYVQGNLAKMQTEFNESDFEKTFEETLTLLVKNKLQQYSKQVREKFSSKLPELLRTTMKVNAEKLTNILTARLGDLIENMPYSKSFDKVMEAAYGQTTAYVATLNDKGIKEKDALIAKMEKGLAVKAKSDKDKALQTRYSEALPTLKKARRKAFLKVFAKQKSAHQDLGEMIEANGAKDPEQYRKFLRDKIQGDLAKEFARLLFPQTSVPSKDGKARQIDGVTALLNRLIIPEELEDLMDCGMENLKEIISETNFKILQEAIPPVKKLMKNLAVGYLKSKIREGLKKAVEKGAALLIVPKKLEELVGESILPAVNEQLFQVFVKQRAVANLPTLAPFLKNVADNPNDAVARKALEDKMFEITQRSTRKFDMTAHGIDQDNFRPIVKSLIEDTTEALSKFKSKQKEALDDTKVVAILKSYFSSAQKKGQEHPIYGNLVMNLVFDIGKFDEKIKSSWWAKKFGKTVMNKLKGTLGATMADSLKDVRKSHQFVVQKATDTVRKKFLKKEKIRELLFSPAKKSTDSKEKFDRAVKKTSALVHDMIFRTVEEKQKRSKLMKFASFFTGDVKHKIPQPAEIEALVQDVYQKFLGDSLVNENLAMKIQDIVLDALKQSSRTIEAKERGVISKVVEEIEV